MYSRVLINAVYAMHERRRTCLITQLVEVGRGQVGVRPRHLDYSGARDLASHICACLPALPPASTSTQSAPSDSPAPRSSNSRSLRSTRRSIASCGPTRGAQIKLTTARHGHEAEAVADSEPQRLDKDCHRILRILGQLVSPRGAQRIRGRLKL